MTETLESVANEVDQQQLAEQFLACPGAGR
jgi:hypothetical protein